MLLEDLKQENLELKNKNETLEIKIQNLELNIQSLKKMLFGPKSEKSSNSNKDADQISFFETDTPANEILEEVSNRTKEDIIVESKDKKAKSPKAGIRKDKLRNVEVNIVEHNINVLEVCPKCQNSLTKIGKNFVRQEIEYIPAKLVITNHFQSVYKCNACEKNKASSTIVKASMPKPLLTHTFLSASLMSEIICNKYMYGLPLYRQERLWYEQGLVAPRNNMANWIIKIVEYYLEPLYNLMKKELLEKNSLMHVDETTMQCNKEEGRKASSNSYMWVMSSGKDEEIRGTIFRYANSRSRETAKEFLKGYAGTIVTDGYNGYNKLKNVKHAECWSHARRYFIESIPLISNKLDTNSLGYKGKEYCDKLFEIEKEIKELSVEDKLLKRKEASKAILEALFGWVNSTLENTIITNDKLQKALTYVKNQREELSEFLKDGNIPLSNNLVERAIRPFAVHRKNWLFADSEAGANSNGVIYSIIESAKANSLNVNSYINYILNKLPQIEDITNESILQKYLPWSKDLPGEIIESEEVV